MSGEVPHMPIPYVTVSERTIGFGEKEVRYHVVFDRMTIDLTEGEAERLRDQLGSALDMSDIEF